MVSVIKQRDSNDFFIRYLYGLFIGAYGQPEMY